MISSELPPDTPDGQDRLASAIRSLPFPPTPDGLEGKVRRRLRRREWRLAGAAAAALLLAGVFAWQVWPGRNAPPPVAHRPKSEPPRSADTLRESAALFSAPPVDSLDVLTRQQDAYISALESLSEEK